MFSNITKKHVILLNKNIKLKEKYYMTKKTHLATAKNFVLHHSLKINKRGGPSKLHLENGNVFKKNSQKVPNPFQLSI